MNRVTGHGLKNLGEQSVSISFEEFADDRRFLLCELYPSRIDAKRGTRDDGDGPRECGLVAGADDAADSTFSPDTGGFRGLAVFKRHDKRRHCSCKGKMGRDHVLVRLEKHLPKGKLDKLDVRLKQFALDNRHSRKEAIARPTASNVVGGHPLPLICCCLE